MFVIDAFTNKCFILRVCCFIRCLKLERYLKCGRCSQVSCIWRRCPTSQKCDVESQHFIETRQLKPHQLVLEGDVESNDFIVLVDRTGHKNIVNTTNGGKQQKNSVHSFCKDSVVST